VTYSGMAIATLPSAQNVFTSEFGMGSGGSRSLWPPGKTGRFFVLRRLSRSLIVVVQSLLD
jgi:hypothetical protein